MKEYITRRKYSYSQTKQPIYILQSSQTTKT